MPGKKDRHPYSPEWQLLARQGLCSLLDERPKLRERLREAGDVFWFDQYRSLGESTRFDSAKGEFVAEKLWSSGVGRLREELVNAWAYRSVPEELRDGRPDMLADLSEALSRVFPGTSLFSLAPMTGLDSERRGRYYVLLRKGENGTASPPYDIAEMSSGEQAVFSLLYEFVMQGIGRSIVLIDELELHLHPPEQQSMLAAIRKIGPDCQFIVTTHSQYIADAVPDEWTVHLGGARACL